MPIYMKYGKIEGPVTGKHKGWIRLDSAQIGVHRNVTTPTERGANREANVPSISEVVVTKPQDSSSARLFNESLQGKGVKVTIDFVEDDNEAPYMSIELENVLISSYSISGSGGDSNNRPIESLSLNFTKITFSTKPTSSSKDPKDSKDKAAWNLATGSSTP